MSVEHKKAKHGPDHRCSTHRGWYGSRLYRNNGISAESNSAHPGQQSIKSVCKIHSVTNSKHHKNDKRIIEPAAQIKRYSGPWNAKSGAVLSRNQQGAHDTGEQQLTE
ncbi:hypothetical protein D3C77_421750 [compost metagenome]